MHDAARARAISVRAMVSVAGVVAQGLKITQEEGMMIVTIVAIIRRENEALAAERLARRCQRKCEERKVQLGAERYAREECCAERERVALRDSDPDVWVEEILAEVEGPN